VCIFNFPQKSFEFFFSFSKINLDTPLTLALFLGNKSLKCHSLTLALFYEIGMIVSGAGHTHTIGVNIQSSKKLKVCYLKILMTPSKFYIPSLDGMRTIAFLLVFLAHTGATKIVPGGFGVTVFFFLSGYLITTLLRREYEKNQFINLKHFYLRRIVRI
jgi:hypothetical protein